MKKDQDYTTNDELLVKYLTGMVDAAEREKALGWIRLNPENSRYFDELRSVYEAAKLTQPGDTYSVETSLNKVKAQHYKNIASSFQKSNLQNINLFRLEILKYAALILFIISLGIFGIRYTRNRPDLASNEIWNTIEAPFGSRARLTLADGTKVWLNAGSQLSYSSEFAQQNRKVYLDGEAYFDVVKNNDMQFIVTTSHLDIKVFGTQFNVKAYKEESIIQTTLVEGSVTISGKGLSGKGKSEVVLNPNETATYYISNKKKSAPEEVNEEKSEKVPAPHKNLEIITDINPMAFTSWKDSKWFIDGETLSGLAVKLERRFNIRITFADMELKNYRFSGTIKDETLEQVLNVIKLSAPIDYTIHDNEVELSENKSFKNSYDELLIKSE